MAQLRGIKVKFTTNNIGWAASNDRLYLGVYWPSGGREFRLNYQLDFSNSGTEYEFGLGDPCCADGIPIVSNSIGNQHNDPSFNTINLDDVQFVYLRKEQGFSVPAPNSDDDALLLNKVEILLCDGQTGLKRFRKEEEFIFSDEAGLQHWIPITSRPPGCEIGFTVTRIEHSISGSNHVGNNWRFFADLEVGGRKLDAFAADNGVWEPDVPKDDWERSYSSSPATTLLVGCCPHEYTGIVKLFAREKDLDVTGGLFGENDDVGGIWVTVPISCSSEKFETTQTASFTVEGNGNREVTIDVTYKITAQCV